VRRSKGRHCHFFRRFHEHGSLRDPVKNIVYNAETEDVETVIINGRTVVENGKVLGRDPRDLNRQVQEAGERLCRSLPPTTGEPLRRRIVPTNVRLLGEEGKKEGHSMGGTPQEETHQNGGLVMMLYSPSSGALGTGKLAPNGGAQGPLPNWKSSQKRRA